MDDHLVIAGRSFASRLFLGTGKFPSNESLRTTIDACGTEMVTVALRRVDPTADEDILDAIPPDQHERRRRRRRGRPLGPPGTGGRPARLDQAGDHPRASLPAPRPRRDAEGRRGAVPGGVHRAAVRERRSRAVQAPRGGGLRHRHAPRQLDRIQPRPAHKGGPGDHRRAVARPRRRRRRHRRPVPGGRSHGARSGRCAGQHRHRYRR